jgi:hypothetical protein
MKPNPVNQASLLFMKASHLFSSSVLMAALLASATTATGAPITISNHQGVSGTLDLDPAKTYLHKLDFPNDGSGDTINGVAFSPAGAGSGTDALTGNPYSLFMENPLDFAGTGLLGDFIHNGGRDAGAVETLILGGFRPGTTYDIRLYYRNFGPRPNDVTIDTDGVPGPEHSEVLDQAAASDLNYWSIVVQAETPVITIQFAQQQFNASWHQYAVSSEVVPGPDNTPVTITSHPQEIIARAGGRATFRVGATGTPPMTFQWFKDAQPIEGATNMVLSIPSVSAADEGYYDVQISNAAGDPVFSNGADLVLGPDFELSVARVPAIGIEGIAGRSVAIEFKNSLDAGTVWQTLTNLTLTTGSAVVVDLEAPESHPRFYRGVQE